MYDLLIKNLGKYVSLTNAEVTTIQSLFTHRKYRKRQYILQEGDIARQEIFVIKGVTRTYEVDEKGQEHIVQFGMEDWWIGDLYSFLSESPSYYNIDCLEDTDTVQISKENMDLLYKKVPKLERHFRIIIQNAFIAATRRVASTMIKAAPERYRDFIEKYPQLEQRIPNHQIASYLGITPQSLSRIRSRTAGSTD